MRLLFWVLLLLLVRTDAASSKIANAATKTSTSESLQSPTLTARALSRGYIADGKRSLGVHDVADHNEDAGKDDEERAISISSILARMKAAQEKFKNNTLDFITKSVNKYNEAMARQLYKMGESPTSLANSKRGGRYKKATAFYKDWYDKNVEAGVIKALD